MIDISKLKELVALMAEHDLAEIEVKNGEEAITIRRGMGAAGRPGGQQYAPALRRRLQRFGSHRRRCCRVLRRP